MFKSRKDWIFSEKHIAKIESIVGQRWGDIRTATFQEDTQESTDLVGYEKDRKKVTIAVRIRRAGYLEKYGDFTIRTTERPKLKKGFGDYYIYSWLGTDGELEQYWLIDLDVLRRSELMNFRPITVNRDGTRFINIPRSELENAGALLDVWNRG